MKLHEYQAKQLLSRFGVAVPAGSAATNVDEAVAAAEELGGGFGLLRLRFTQVAEERAGF